MNQVFITGNLGSEPKATQTPNGNTAVRFNICNNTGQKDAAGNSVPNWITCSAWNNQANYLVNMCHTGDTLLVEGRLQERRYVDKNGQNRVSHEVVCRNVYLIRKKGTTMNNSFEGYAEDVPHNAIDQVNNSDYDDIFASDDINQTNENNKVSDTDSNKDVFEGTKYSGKINDGDLPF